MGTERLVGVNAFSGEPCPMSLGVLKPLCPQVPRQGERWSPDKPGAPDSVWNDTE